MSQSQELQNSKIDRSTTKSTTLNGRIFTGAGNAVSPSDLVPLSQVKALIDIAVKMPASTATAQTTQGIPNNPTVPTSGGTPIIIDSLANWTLAKYDPANRPIGQEILITDWNVKYIVQNPGTGNAWLYEVGVLFNTTAPTLSFNGSPFSSIDQGFLWVNTSALGLQISYWDNGSSAWIEFPYVPPSATVLASDVNSNIIPAVGFTGTLAAAVAGGKNVVNGLIQP